MSKTLVCLQEAIPFYAQESASEMLYSYDDSTVKGSTPSYGDGSRIVPQDENACVEGHAPRVFSRKREATNILMECVKRRDNLRNIDLEFICNVPPVWDSAKVYEPLCPVEPTKNQKLEGDPMVKMDFVASSSVDSKLVQLPKDVSSCQDIDDVLRINSKDDDDVLDSKLAAVDDIKASPDLSLTNCKDQGCVSSKDEGRSPFNSSLFARVAHTLYFPMKDEKVSLLPDEILARMKWKLSTITPVLIREMLIKMGFKLLEAETTDNWIGTWGKHLKCALFKDVKPFQKINHFPGSFHLGRKDKLWANIKRLRERQGPLACDFFPDTFLLPQDLGALRDAWDADKCWILKPPASARGTGVKVIYKWSQVPKTKPMIVQRYLSDPYLINGTKFDLRVYVLVPSIEPLRIYVFQDGLVRFASQKYSLSDKSFSNRFIHLTNYSVNRKSSTYTHNEDENSCQGHKWTLKAFWTYMTNSGIDVAKIKETIIDMIIKTIICSETPVMRLLRTYAKSTYNCFELFGFDIMLDKNLKPWLLEVNISPSLHTRSMLDSSVKGHLVQDVFNLVGFQIPGNMPHLSEQEEYGITSMMANKHKSPKHRFLTPEEKKKHSYHTFEYPHQGSDILGSLTPDDVRCLVESEDEFHRRGSFSRIFPTHTTSRYFPLFEHTRYYNLLLDAWEKTFHAKRHEGIQHLQSLCKESFHLKRNVPEGYCLVRPDPAPESA